MPPPFSKGRMNWHQVALDRATRWSDAGVVIDMANEELAKVEARRAETKAVAELIRDGLHYHMMGDKGYCGFTLAELMDGLVESLS